MWESLSGLLSSGTTPWIIGILSAVIGSWWALRKLRYEKRLEKFKETNANLFKDKKQEVLAAIATLSIFKRDPEFEKNTIDVLLSRLYTELDYDIINSILTTLIQDSNRDDLLYIADGLQDINRNFFVKNTPMTQRIDDINGAIKNLDVSFKQYETDAASYDTLVKERKYEAEIFIRNKDIVYKQYDADFSDLFAFQKYKLVWHKQVTADAYAMFMRKAHLAQRGAKLSMNLFQNDFNFVYMAQVTTTDTRIVRSAFGDSLFVEVNLENLFLFKNDFFKSRIFQSSFKNGEIVDTLFSSVIFEDVIFENIHFKECTFDLVSFKKVAFVNCTGLTQEQFNGSIQYDHECRFPEGIVIQHEEDYVKQNGTGTEAAKELQEAN